MEESVLSGHGALMTPDGKMRRAGAEILCRQPGGKRDGASAGHGLALAGELDGINAGALESPSRRQRHVEDDAHVEVAPGGEVTVAGEVAEAVGNEVVHPSIVSPTAVMFTEAAAGEAPRLAPGADAPILGARVLRGLPALAVGPAVDVTAAPTELLAGAQAERPSTAARPMAARTAFTVPPGSRAAGWAMAFALSWARQGDTFPRGDRCQGAESPWSPRCPGSSPGDPAGIWCAGVLAAVLIG